MGTKVKSWRGAMNYRYKSHWPIARISQKEIKEWWKKVKDTRWKPYQDYPVFQGRAE